jgi:hypothetical protein
MNDATASRSPALAWSVALAVSPLVYLASTPWVGITAWKMGFFEQGPVLGNYMRPYEWLSSHSPAGAMLDTYEQWCYQASHTP